MSRLAFIALILSSIGARADDVLMLQPDRRLIAIRLAEGKTFEPGEKVCINRLEIKVACGTIFKKGGKGIIIFIVQGSIEVLKVGFDVEVAIQTISPTSRIITLGIDYKFPMLHFQQLFNNRMAYGFIGEGVYFKKEDSSLKGIIAMFSVSYYGRGVFRGPWLMFAAGLHIVNRQYGNLSEETGDRTGITSLVTQANVGWRFRMGDASLGLAVGGKYFLDPLTHFFSTSKGFFASAIVDFGFTF